LTAQLQPRSFSHACTFAFQTPGTQALDFDLPDKRHGARSIEIVNWANVADLAVEDMSMISPTWRALGQVVLVYFAFGSAAVTAQDSQPGRATFAEMIAFARLASVACQRLAPDADSFHAVALRRLIKPPLTEEEIAAKEKDVKRLRVRLGLSRWCKRYAGVTEQARILVQVLRKQN
jgi:hypothetical protein